MKPSPLVAGLFVFGLLSVGAVTFSLLPQETTQAPAYAEGQVKWRLYDKGLKEAQQSGKPIFVQFFATWCGYCRKMDQETFTNAAVQKELAAFVPIRVTESSEQQVQYQGKAVTEKELTVLHGVQGFPTLLFMEPDGQIIGKIPGYLGPQDFQSVLKFISSRAYKKMDYEKFRSTQLKS